MPKAKNAKADEAFVMFRQGLALNEIAKRLELPEGTVRRWKSTYKWSSDGSERSDKKQSERSQKKRAGNGGKKRQGKSCDAEGEELTEKQRKFCLFYVRCFNATRAYQKAYKCTYSTAMTEGCKTLRNPKIKSEIENLKQNRLNKDLLKEEDIFQRYIDIAFADITDYVSFGMEERPVITAAGVLTEKDPETGEKKTVMQEVSVVRLNESDDVDGTLLAEVKQGRDGISVKLNDRMKALAWLADHMDMATEEQRARIGLLKVNADRIRSIANPEEDEGVIIINDAPG